MAMKLALIGFAVFLQMGFAVITTGDLEAAFQDLQQAGSAKDAPRVKTLAERVFTLADEIIAMPAPESEVEREFLVKQATFARQTKDFTEYVLYSTALQTPPALTAELMETLERHNPKSKYLEEAYGRYLVALNQSGASARIPAIAEKALANFPENEDLLLVLADAAMEKKQSGNALNYAQRLIAVLNKHPQPEGMAAADWGRKRTAALGRSHWIAGMVQSERNQYFAADKSLRAALPLIKGNDAMTAPALYFLALANYQLGKMTLNKAQVLEAAKFSEQAAAINGPLAQNAWRNSVVMKAEADKMR
jgi:hypothetical protein